MPSSLPPSRLSRLRLRVALVASVILALTLSASPAMAANSTGDPILSDGFDRSISAGWGSTPAGVAYDTTPEGVASVQDGEGILHLKPGTFAVSSLKGATSLDSTVTSTFSLDSAVESGNGTTVSLGLRARDGFQYQARARFATGERVVLAITRYDGSTAREVTLAGWTVAARGVQAGTPIIVEFAATGTDAVELTARAWAAGSPRPAHQLKTTDRSDRRIAQDGHSSVGAYQSIGSPAAVVRFSDLEVTPGRDVDPTPPPVVEPPVVEPPVAEPPVVTPPVVTPPVVTPPVVEPPAEAGNRGSLPVGQARYSVPSGAVFASPSASGQGDGTQSRPYRTAQQAVDAARAGSTVVLRAGTYHESLYIPRGKSLTIQSYPGEAVWFDGARSVTNWTRSQSTWVSSNWNHSFDSRVSFTKGRDESSRFLDPAYPMAGHPDQLFIDGVSQSQVGSAAAVRPGTFFVDTARKQLVIGTDPTGKRVEASAIDKAIQVHATDTTLRGFGVRRYANTLSLMGAISTEVPRATLENLVITQNATVGLYAWAEGHTFRNLTVADNGLMGVGANKANGLTLTDSAITRNNTERFKWAPVSGGVKITESERVTVRNNLIADNTTGGLWFDVSTFDVRVVGNTIRHNATFGVHVELSSRAVVADNRIHDNGKGIIVFNSNEVDIWNNALARNGRSLEFMQDERRQENASLTARIPWVMSNVRVSNNAISYGSGSCPILTQDLTKRWSGNNFGVSFDANIYHRASASAPSNFACWANGAAGTRSFKTLSEFASHTGGDKKSAIVEGGSIFNSALAITSAGRAPGVTPATLPTRVATALERDRGVATVGVLPAR